MIPWWGWLLPQAQAGHSANHRLHRTSSRKCLANPEATYRSGLWWTWHLFISSIFGTKCIQMLELNLIHDIIKFAFKVKDTWSTADNCWHHCCSGVASVFSMNYLVCTTAPHVDPHRVPGAVKSSLVQGPNTVQFAQSVSDIHLPVSHPSWRSAALARRSLKWPRACPISEEKLEKGKMQYVILHAQIHKRKWYMWYKSYGD